MLTIQEYERCELEAVAGLPNRIIEMVNPVVFASEGYPLRLRSDSELWKFLDVMHETRFEGDFAHLFGGGISEEEFFLIQKTAEAFHRFGTDHCKCNQTTRSSLLRALHTYVQIVDLFEGKTARVLEIGPGSGALGCLFIQNGWGYAGSDITQAFYILQSRLWDFVSGNKLEELASDNVWDNVLSPGKPVHIPWWKFYKLLEKNPPSVDIVTCNHALAEMHPNSLAFVLRAARTMLDGEGEKFFAFEGWGFEKFVTRATITEQFYRFGFQLLHTDDKLTVFIPAKKESALNTTNSKPPSFAKRALRVLNQKLNHPIGHTRLIARRINPLRSQISQKLLAGRSHRATNRTVKLDQVNAFYSDLLQTTDFRTGDEKFLDLIG